MKKYLALLSVLMAVIFAACGGGADTDGKQGGSVDTDEKQEESADTDEKYTDSADTDEEQDGSVDTNENPFGGGFFENAKYIGDDQTISTVSVFMDGRAWVQFGVFETTTALIDKEGKILWESNAKVEEVSEIRDGLAYCRLAGEEYDTYVLLDSDGNVTFTKECDENYIILGQGDGLFLVAEHVLSFDANEWRLGAIDKDGNTVVPFKAYETITPIGVNSAAYEPRMIGIDEEHSYECTYVGDGVFDFYFFNKRYGMRINALLNIEAQSVIFTHDTYNDYSSIDMEFISEFENGSATVLMKTKYEGVICTLSLEGELTPIVENEEWGNLLAERFPWVMAFSDGLFYTDGSYYNLDGECVIDFPQYRGKHDYSCGAFVDGYAFMNIVGADGENYITVIDKNGSLMFEPVSGFGKAVWSDGNYLVSGTEGSITVFDINGTMLYSMECKCISHVQYETALSEGVLVTGDFYLNLESGTVIGEHKDGMIITKY